MDVETSEKLAGYLGAALGDPVRMRIVLLLADKKEMLSGEIQQAVDKNWSNVSQHLVYLRRFGVVQSRKDAQRVLYSLSDPKFGRMVKTLIRDTEGLLESE